MISNTKHIIKRQVIDVTVPDKVTGTQVQDRISEIYDSIIIPIFDNVLNDMNLSDEILRIDQLELDLGDLSFDNLTDDIRIQLKSKLEDELVKIVYRAKNNITQKGVEIRKLSKRLNATENLEPQLQTIGNTNESVKSDFYIFEEYLKTGMLPWWSKDQKIDILQLFLSIVKKKWEKNEVSRIHSLLRFRNVRHRLINVLMDSDLSVFLSKIHVKKGEKVTVIGSEIHKLILDVENVKSIHKFARIEILDSLIKELILTQSSADVYSDLELATSVVRKYLHKNFNAKYVLKFQSKVQKLKTWKFSFGEKEDFVKSLSSKLKSSLETIDEFKNKEPKQIQTSLDTNATIKQEELESLTVGNAGLIIIWPYLEIFFRELGLLNSENQFCSESDTWRAIQLLHYLSYGNEVAEESELILNKLICNLPIESSVPIVIELSDEEKFECENLLEAVLKNWKALKSTSIEGLRQSFIIREGVFSNDQSGWSLSIERRSYDLLLDKLSWPISVIKLPWNPNLIHVRW